jgi:hypothetical protein
MKVKTHKMMNFDFGNYKFREGSGRFTKNRLLTIHSLFTILQKSLNLYLQKHGFKVYKNSFFSHLF